MPKHKKKDESSDSDSGPEDRGPAKKTKKTRDDDEEPCWSLDKRRMIKVREFKGKVFIDIREYYEDNGDLKPGKKGISLSPAQWQKLKDAMEEVDDVLKKKC